MAAANPAPRATLSQVADHIDHIRKVAGIDHIGLGGDFDGITEVVQGLEDVSTYPALTAELLKRGYTDDDIKKILGAERAAGDAAGGESGGGAAEDPPAIDGDDRTTRRQVTITYGPQRHRGTEGNPNTSKCLRAV